MFALGFVWLAWFAQLPSGATGLGVTTALAAGIAPFIWGDLLKSALTAFLVPVAWSLLKPAEG